MLVTTQKSSPNQSPAIERRGRMPRFGVAIFDSDVDLTSGWASLAGAPAFRFRNPIDLPSDSIWVTSCSSYERFGPLNSNHNLRPSYFFPTELKYIASDIGMAAEGDDWSRPAAVAISEIINRSVMIAAQVYKWEDPIQYLRSDMFMEDIKSALSAPANTPLNMKAPLLSALQMSSKVTVPFEQNSVDVTLRLNRLAYAKKILSTPIPDGVWSYMGHEDTPDFSYSVERACDTNFPCLVEATVETGRASREISEMIAFGVTGSKKVSLRSWISQPELQWLSKYANIKISRVYYTTSHRPLIERYQLPELMQADELWELSMAAGLVAESHWRGLAKDTYDKNAPGRKSTTVTAVWLRAADRSMCFELALRASTAGFAVKGYGNGAVTVKVPRSKLTDLLDFAMDNGIAHPAFREVLRKNGIL